MNSLMHWNPAGFAFSPGTIIMVEGAPVGMHLSATYGGRTVLGRFVPRDPESVTNAPDRYVVDVSSFTSEGDAPPGILLQMNDARDNWTTETAPNNSVGQVIPFSSFAKGTPWTGAEKALAVGAGVVEVGGLAWYFWPKKR